MQSISTLYRAATEGEPQQQATGAAVKNLFLVMQGSYGSLFLSKFATGVLDSGGRDLGVRTAMRVWSAALAKYDPGVIETAVARLPATHPDFPPHLPQFEALCRAATPRRTHAQLQGWSCLPAPAASPVSVQLVPVGDGKDWARRILARARAGDRTITRTVLRNAMQALHMEGAPR
ncbi:MULTISPECIES: hypothetical protein [Pseudomonadota]|uniref:hypothetical protein n=1 Tax=Pseudomonadota TaxID=1224 RepID=UPI00030C224A|nr:MULTISPECIES: hypothetical protein [Pseudomonadota]MPT02069.1 hypothetical protein [Pseudomonas sp.]MPT52544.1 hypothetical protein [Delftia sp.]SFB65078.1 hypothetical protein SAMN05444579_12167 [Delftia tsuruhatensis]